MTTTLKSLMATALLIFTFNTAQADSYSDTRDVSDRLQHDDDQNDAKQRAKPELFERPEVTLQHSDRLTFIAR